MELRRRVQIPKGTPHRKAMRHVFNALLNADKPTAEFDKTPCAKCGMALVLVLKGAAGQMTKCLNCGQYVADGCYT